MCLQQHQQEREQATSGLEVDVMADSKKYDGSQWKHSLRKLTTATEAVENPLYSDGTAITAYTLKGNTVQDGTPTPSNPVEVQGVGVRTENLFNAIWESGSIGANGGMIRPLLCQLQAQEPFECDVFIYGLCQLYF